MVKETPPECCHRRNWDVDSGILVHTFGRLSYHDKVSGSYFEYF